MNLVVTFAVAISLSAFVIPPATRVASRLGMLDQPTNRKVHLAPIPRTGGWGIVLGALVPVLFSLSIDPLLLSYFLGVFVYLMFTAVIPLTQSGQWRGWIDMLAVGSYLAGVVPLGGIAALELGLICRDRDDRQKLGIHAALISLFLVVGHIAMVFGMVDPRLGGWAGTPATMQAPAAGGHGSH